jgi:putative DNA primase/helicase
MVLINALEIHADTKTLIEPLFHHSSMIGQFIELRFIPNKGMNLNPIVEFVLIHENFTETLEEVTKITQKYPHFNCYYGVASRTEKKGSTEYCGNIATIYVDYDEFNGQKFKVMSDDQKRDMKTILKGKLVESSFLPSYIVDSGNGIHAYWVLNQPVEVTQNRLRIEAILNYFTHLVPEFQGDTACTRVAQIMRLPGTYNVKNTEAPALCQVLHSNPNCHYKWEAMLELIESGLSNPSIDKSETKESLYASFHKMAVDVVALREVAMGHEFFKTLYENPNRQSYDLWLHLASNCTVFGQWGRQLFHEISESYQGYDANETNKLFDRLSRKVVAGEVGPSTYKTIESAGLFMKRTYAQASPAGTVINELRLKSNQHSNEHDLKMALENLLPRGNDIDNMRELEAFIQKHLMPLKESMAIKMTYLKESMKKLHIQEKGNLTHLKEMLKTQREVGADENIYISIANEIMKEKPLINIGKTFYRYQGGYWQEIKADIKTIIVQKLLNQYKKSTSENILYYLEAKTNIVPSEVNKHIQSKLISLKNGMLDISNPSFAQVKLLPHKEDYYCMNQLDIEFNHSATSPLWEQFLLSTFINLPEVDRKLTIQALQEFMGYLLIAGNELQKMMFLIGQPRTGKGIIMSIMNKLLGDHNVSAISIGEIHKEGNMIQLFGKLVNMGGEIDEREKFKASLIKSLTGEDKVQGRAIYKSPVSFYNEAKLIFASNHLPKFMDKSDAIDARSLCIPVNEYVPEHKRDPKLKEKLICEIDGILNWAIKGRIRLMQRGHFIDSPSMLALKVRMKEENNSVAYWFNRAKVQLDRQPTFYTLKSLFEQYKTFCEGEEMKPLIRKNFKSVFEQMAGIDIRQPTKPDQLCVYFDWKEIDGKVTSRQSIGNDDKNDVPLSKELISSNEVVHVLDKDNLNSKTITDHVYKSLRVRKPENGITTHSMVAEKKDDYSIDIEYVTTSKADLTSELEDKISSLFTTTIRSQSF